MGRGLVGGVSGTKANMVDTVDVGACGRDSSAGAVAIGATGKVTGTIGKVTGTMAVDAPADCRGAIPLEILS